MSNAIDKFAFIFHPHDVESLGDWVLCESQLKTRTRRTVERSLRWLPPIRRECVTGLISSTGKEIQGEMILWPLIPEQIMRMDSAFILKKLTEAGRLAQRLGARIVGLGAYAAIIGKRGVELAKELDIAVTTGTCYTIAMAVESIREMARRLRISISGATLTVVGATGCIGKVVSEILARDFQEVHLVARHKGKLEQLREYLVSLDSCRAVVRATDQLERALRNSEFVLCVTNTPSAIIDVGLLPPGSILCDLSLPRNVSETDAAGRRDIIVLDGGVVRPPGPVDFHFNFGLPSGLAYACMAETMILTFEGVFENYSLGGSVSAEKVDRISAWGEKHGFVLAEFKSFGKNVGEDRLDFLREIISSK